MLVNPIAFLSEGRRLQGAVSNAFDLVTVDGDALVTNPYHVIANRLRELSRSNGRHGSCGMGIGETVADFESNGEAVLRVRDLASGQAIREKLTLCRDRYRRELAFLKLTGLEQSIRVQVEQAMLHDDSLIEYCVHEYTQFAMLVRIVDSNYLPEVLAKPGTVLFEGAQGVLLDEEFGFFPHVTRSKTTFVNANTLLTEAGFKGEVQRIGVTRAYMTRHGAGPFPTEDQNLRFEDHNVYGPWQEGFRFGHLDGILLQYAIDACGGIDGFAVTCLDQARDTPFRFCGLYTNAPEHPSFVSARHIWEVLEIKAEFKSLSQQQELGKALDEVSPEYYVMSRSHPKEFLESFFNKPVLIQSFGRTAKDKVRS
jgi:adenylosuccinate synthase